MVAKEVVVSSMSAVATQSELLTIFTPLTAYVFCVFVLLYIPCFAVVATIKQETNGYKWPLFACGICLVTAYIVSFIFYHVGLFLGFS